MKPYQQINKDLKALAEIAIQNLQFTPDAQLQVIGERKVKRILERYYSKKKQYPKSNSI